MAYDTELDRRECTFSSAFEFKPHLIQTMSENRASGIVKRIVYTNVPQPWAMDALDALEENGLACLKKFDPSTKEFFVQTMPTQLHNAAQEWLSRSREDWLLHGILTRAERNTMITTVESLFRFTSGPFVGLVKAPSLAIQSAGIGWPGVVFECGYSQSLNSLLDDARHWLVGSDGATRAVVLVDWRPSRETMTASGDVALYTLDQDGMLHLQQKGVFPAPRLEGQQVLRMTRHHFFGPTIAGNRQPGDIFELDVSVLRTVATELMAHMGYTPPLPRVFRS